MAGENCVSAAAQKNGSATDEDIRSLRMSAPSLVSEMVASGKDMTLSEFRKVVTSHGGDHYDPRTEEFLSQIWFEGIDGYNKNRPKDTPEITPKLADYLPDYSSFREVKSGDEVGMDAAAAKSINEGLRRAAASGVLAQARGVSGGDKSVPNSEEQAAAIRLLSTELQRTSGPALTADEFRRRTGATPTQAVYYLRALRENVASAISDMGVDLLKAQHELEVLTLENKSAPAIEAADGRAASLEVQQMQMFNMLSYLDAQQAGNASHIGRALQALRDTSRLLRTGSAKANLYNVMFPDGKVTGLTNPHMDAIKAISQAKDAAIGIPTPEQAKPLPESPTKATGLNKDTAFTTAEGIDGVAKRFAEGYDTARGLTAQEQNMLLEIGMHSYALYPDADFKAWSQHIQQITGRKLPPDKLVEIYQAMRKTFFKTLRDDKGLMRKSVAMAKNTIFGEAQAKAIAELRKLRWDNNNPAEKEATRKQMEEILRKYQKDTPMLWLAELANLKRAVRTAFDQSAPMRQAAFVTLGWGLNPTSFASPEWFAGDAKMQKSIIDAQQRRKIVGHALLDMAMSKNDKFFQFGKRLRDTKAMSSEEFAANIMEEIMSRPDSDLYAEHGLALTKIGDMLDLTGREEAFQSIIAERMRESPNPVMRYMGEGIHSSERAYAVYLNRIRADAFDHITSVYKSDGYTPFNSPDLYTDTAKMINDLTGRSDLPMGNGSARLLSTAYFSARFQTSIAKRLLMPIRAGASFARQKAAKDFNLPISELEQQTTQNFMHITDMHPKLQAEVMGNTARMMSAYAVLAGLALLFKGTVDSDPRSSDFLKLKFGNTRLDVLGGAANWIRFLAKMKTGESVNPVTRSISRAGGNMGRRAAFHQFWDAKAAPLPADAEAFIFGSDAVGHEVVPSLDRPITSTEVWKNKKLRDRMLSDFVFNNSPMHIREIADGATQGGALGGALSLLAYFGVGVNTYDSRKKPERLPSIKPPRGKGLPVIGDPSNVRK